MTRNAIYLGMIAAFAAGMLAAWNIVPRDKQPATQLAPRPQNPLSLLIPKVDLDDTSYGEAMNYLRQLTHINLVADWDALRQLEVTPTTPLHIDLHLRNVTLGQVLDLICMSFEEPHPTFDSYVWTGYQLENGFIVFTRIHLQGDHDPFETRVYDVTHILEHPFCLPTHCRSFDSLVASSSTSIDRSAN